MTQAAQAQINGGLVPGDIIIATLSITKPNGQRRGISATFDHEGFLTDAKGQNRLSQSPALNLSATGGPEPEFPAAEVERLIRENKKAEADSLTVAFYHAVQQFKEQGGVAGADAVGRAVYGYVCREHGVTEQDQTGPVLALSEVLVNAPSRINGAPGVWVVQMAPKWGHLLPVAR